MIDLKKYTNESQIQKKLHELRMALIKLRAKLANGKLKKTHQIKETKKDIARLLTKLREFKKNG